MWLFWRTFRVERVQGIPFEFNAGAYDNLNMWEQIDDGDQYTPTKKFLLTVPIVLSVFPAAFLHVWVVKSLRRQTDSSSAPTIPTMT